MQLLVIIPMAVGLSMDALAVSVVTGSVQKKLKVTHALQMALFFGAFQAFMPLVGSLAGLTIKNYIADYDHWVAFGILTAIGGKMIYESFKIAPNQHNFDPANIFVLLVLSVATSIDALAVGITLSFLTVGIALAVLVIGTTTFVMSSLGVYLGSRFGHFFASKIEALGGLILIGLGIKILIEHLFTLQP